VHHPSRFQKTKCLHRSSNLDGFFARTYTTENEHETWKLECQVLLNLKKNYIKYFVILPPMTLDARKITKTYLNLEISKIIKLKTYFTSVRFQVLTAANMKTSVFWDVAQCMLVEVYRRFFQRCLMPLLSER
jgi:hypothetical protein